VPEGVLYQSEAVNLKSLDQLQLTLPRVLPHERILLCRDSCLTRNVTEAWPLDGRSKGSWRRDSGTTWCRLALKGRLEGPGQEGLGEHCPEGTRLQPAIVKGNERLLPPLLHPPLKRAELAVWVAARVDSLEPLEEFFGSAMRLDREPASDLLPGVGKGGNAGAPGVILFMEI